MPLVCNTLLLLYQCFLQKEEQEYHGLANRSYHVSLEISYKVLDFPGGAVVKNPPANAGDTGSSPGPGRSHMS